MNHSDYAMWKQFIFPQRPVLLLLKKKTPHIHSSMLNQNIGLRDLLAVECMKLQEWYWNGAIIVNSDIFANMLYLNLNKANAEIWS